MHLTFRLETMVFNVIETGWSVCSYRTFYPWLSWPYFNETRTVSQEEITWTCKWILRTQFFLKDLVYNVSFFFYLIKKYIFVFRTGSAIAVLIACVFLKENEAMYNVGRPARGQCIFFSETYLTQSNCSFRFSKLEQNCSQWKSPRK